LSPDGLGVCVCVFFFACCSFLFFVFLRAIFYYLDYTQLLTQQGVKPQFHIIHDSSAIGPNGRRPAWSMSHHRIASRVASFLRRKLRVFSVHVGYLCISFIL
jgi:hypothetical protein